MQAIDIINTRKSPAKKDELSIHNWIRDIIPPGIKQRSPGFQLKGITIKRFSRIDRNQDNYSSILIHPAGLLQEAVSGRRNHLISRTVHMENCHIKLLLLRLLHSNNPLPIARNGGREIPGPFTQFSYLSGGQIIASNNGIVPVTPTRIGYKFIPDDFISRIADPP